MYNFSVANIIDKFAELKIALKKEMYYFNVTSGRVATRSRLDNFDDIISNSALIFVITN